MNNNDFSSSNSTTIQSTDILCSSMEQYKNHSGNQLLLHEITTYLAQRQYDAALSQQQQEIINVTKSRVEASYSIIGIMRNRHKGRFLAKTKRGTWKDVGDALALRWVSLYIKRHAESESSTL
eukprot:CAMPEP_0116565886 /NCGR_PEP_ID=MMETSP0397-20121206/14139_1 /TAXON_ID=216820 /ORGANISM="Cyclophora tenuis, Strain ECT3854" /LENGTH=122 /DNA_ID=CAMNT_0004092693 /DNA_START=42 /DNA_END=410 /DNA_ORIENTATION=-